MQRRLGVLPFVLLALAGGVQMARQAGPRPASVATALHVAAASAAVDPVRFSYGGHSLPAWAVERLRRDAMEPAPSEDEDPLRGAWIAHDLRALLREHPDHPGRTEHLADGTVANMPAQASEPDCAYRCLGTVAGGTSVLSVAYQIEPRHAELPPEYANALLLVRLAQEPFLAQHTGWRQDGEDTHARPMATVLGLQVLRRGTWSAREVVALQGTRVMVCGRPHRRSRPDVLSLRPPAPTAICPEFTYRGGRIAPAVLWHMVNRLGGEGDGIGLSRTGLDLDAAYELYLRRLPLPDMDGESPWTRFSEVDGRVCEAQYRVARRTTGGRFVVYCMWSFGGRNRWATSVLLRLVREPVLGAYGIEMRTRLYLGGVVNPTDEGSKKAVLDALETQPSGATGLPLLGSLDLSGF